MPRICTICQHRQLAAIEEALAARESYRSIAAQYDVSPSALFRHKRQGHRQDKPPEWDTQPAPVTSTETELRRLRAQVAWLEAERDRLLLELDEHATGGKDRKHLTRRKVSSPEPRKGERRDYKHGPRFIESSLQDLDELRESTRLLGWIETPGSPVVDENDAIIDGRRRPAVVAELGIDPLVTRIEFGVGPEADEKRMKLFLAAKHGPAWFLRG